MVQSPRIRLDPRSRHVRPSLRLDAARTSEGGARKRGFEKCPGAAGQTWAVRSLPYDGITKQPCRDIFSIETIERYIVETTRRPRASSTSCRRSSSFPLAAASTTGGWLTASGRTSPLRTGQLEQMPGPVKLGLKGPDGVLNSASKDLVTKPIRPPDPHNPDPAGPVRGRPKLRGGASGSSGKGCADLIQDGLVVRVGPSSAARSRACLRFDQQPPERIGPAICAEAAAGGCPLASGVAIAQPNCAKNRAASTAAARAGHCAVEAWQVRAPDSAHRQFRRIWRANPLDSQ